ncbi:MAG TPA: hypothetical protein VNW53_04640 [Phenylobacterium sp.]|uniref:hypothetical protein n=1 Tax=Phenylobacterium sp. TaxID=1871053 RepID=UPI002B99667C|nr:hypothetical protein [Phenylobacterium sp.]HXA38266.1 hypothetical protein [Phenylobacterium sp.]
MRAAAVIAALASAAAFAAAAAPTPQAGPVPAKASPPASTVSGITVEGPAKQDPLVDRATEFVRQRLPASRFEQYARFRDPICVRVVGLPAEFDAFVARRVVEVAREVKAPVAEAATCTPNVNVIFSPRPQAQLADIARRRDILFGFYFRAELKKLITFSRPVQAWYLTRAVGADGRGVLELNDPAPCQGTGLPGAPPCDLKAPPLTGRAGSRLGTDMSSELAHSLILADANRVAGEKIEAVADYIAVLALSRWQGLERCSGLPTILNLMADGCEAEDRPEAATPQDLALLTGLYRANAREAGTLQRAEIAGAMRKAGEDPGKGRR